MKLGTAEPIHQRTRIVEELAHLLGMGGTAGGLMTPSIYETAQVLRFYPPPEGPIPGLEWLARQQEADGGWGHRATPLYRIVPTLAAILALHAHRDVFAAQQAIEAGLTYLADLPASCVNPLPETIPIAFELILPQLLGDAVAEGLPVSDEPYRAVIALGQRRLAKFALHAPPPNSSPFVSWEAWGKEPLEDHVHPVGGVGHSAAATARWLQLACHRPELRYACRQAEEYLYRAANATGSKIPGVVPLFWPIARFEQSFMLHALVLAGIMDLPELQPALQGQLEELWSALTPHGLGFSDYFVPDGDDTAAAVSVLYDAGYPVAPSVLAAFQRSTHFSAFPHELHTSLTVTARATHALAMMGHRVENWQCAIVEAQQSDGWWYGDKWNISRFYSTCLALSALKKWPVSAVWHAARRILLASQGSEGSWCDSGRDALLETAYALLALWMVHDEQGEDAALARAVAHGHCFLARHAHSATYHARPIWIGKDLFSPPRIDRSFILSALLAPYGDRTGARMGQRHRRLKLSE
jgi:hypothetical protein